MKYQNIILLTLLLIGSCIVNAVQTPSGKEIPESLLNYLDCPIGDVKCKNDKNKDCIKHSKICRNGNPLILDELLENNGIDIGDMTAEEYCNIYNEVCEMIFNYDSPISDDDVYNFGKYYTCESDDLMCKIKKTSICRTVLKKCNGGFPEEDCNKLSLVCSGINGNNMPSFMKIEGGNEWTKEKKKMN